MKKYRLGTLCVLLVAFFSSCGKEQVISVNSVKLDITSLSLEIGESKTLIATIQPSDATNGVISWTSSQPAIATVSSSGVVTAISEGNTAVTATAGGKSASCVVTVSKKVIEVISIELDKTSIELTEGETITLTASIKPENASDKTLTWSSSEPSIASVDNGMVVANSEGSATITASVGGKTASCLVVVSKVVIPVESIELNFTSVELHEGESKTLIATVKPENASYKVVTWSSSNSDVAVVNAGVITAIKEGKAIITAQVSDKSSTCEVNVQLISPSITFADAELKAILVKKYDTDGNGEISMDEAASVTSFGSQAFKNGTFKSFNELQYFVGLTAIESFAFYNCSFLEEITFPEQITAVEEYAFNSCAQLKDIQLPSNLKRIGSAAFEGCSSLTEVNLPEGIEVLEAMAFSNCSSLKTITIPTTLNKVGSACFWTTLQTNPLERINISSLEKWCQIQFEDFIANPLMSAKYLYLDGQKLEQLAIPETITEIKSYAFCGGLFTSVTLPNSITKIGDGAFMQCTQMSLNNIPEQLESIGSNAFNHCEYITTFRIPTGVRHIGVGAFSGCKRLTTVTLPDGLESIEETTFSDCPVLSSVDIPESVKSIGRMAFSSCSNILHVKIPSQVTIIDEGAFSFCKSLTNVELQEGLVEIGRKVFEHCSDIISIVIPSSVSKIGSRAFYNCGRLKTVTVLPVTPPTLDTDVFGSTNLNVIYVPSQSLETYKTTIYWRDYASKMQGKDMSSMNHPFVKSISWAEGSNSNSASFQYNSSKQITSVTYNGNTETFSYENYNAGDGSILFKSGSHSYTMDVEGGLLDSVDNDKYTYSEKKLQKRSRSTNNYIEFQWDGGCIQRIYYYIDGNMYETTISYSDKENPFTNQRINIQLFCLGRLEFDMFAELGFCGQQSAKLPQSDVTTCNGIQTSSESYGYEFSDGVLTKVYVTGNSNMTYTLSY